MINSGIRRQVGLLTIFSFWLSDTPSSAQRSTNAPECQTVKN